jgi:toxin HigB-1
LLHPGDTSRLAGLHSFFVDIPHGRKAFLSVPERKLAQLEAAQTLDFLKAPPGNHLEALKGDRKGQHSIRINAQWRICFVWTDVGPSDVENVDYH